jgi:hypothetical protein
VPLPRGARHRARTFGRPRRRPFQPHRPPGLVARPRHQRGTGGVRLPPTNPRRRPPVCPAVLPPGAMHGTGGAASTEATGKDDGIRQLAYRIIDRRRPHVLGRAPASFGRRRHPRRPEAHSFGSGSKNAGDGSTLPPQGGGRCGLATTFAGDEEVVGDGDAGTGGPPWRR